MACDQICTTDLHDYMGNVYLADHGPISPTIFPSQLKFSGNFIFSLTSILTKRSLQNFVHDSSSLGLAGGELYQKNTILIFRLVLQNFAIPGCFPYILFCCYLFSSLSSGWFVILYLDKQQQIANNSIIQKRECILLSKES